MHLERGEQLLQTNQKATSSLYQTTSGGSIVLGRLGLLIDPELQNLCRIFRLIG